MPSAHERGQQVLDRLDRGRVAGQPGGELDPRQVIDCGRDLEISQVRPDKSNSVIGRRGLERQRDLVSRMQADARARNRRRRCALSVM